MINTLLNIAKIIIAMLPTVLFYIGLRKSNLPKPDRNKQVLMPLIALIYVIFTMCLLNYISVWLIKLIDAIPKWIASLAAVSWMPEKVAEIILEISKWIKAVIKNLNLNFWIFFVANAAIVAVYLWIKKICIKIFEKAVKTDGALHTKISGLFYEFFSEKSKWCLKEDYVQVRSTLKVFFYGASVLSALLMLVSSKLYYYGMVRAVFYPVFGVILLGEIFFYLDGATKREYASEILGEDEDAYRIANYSLLRKFLRSVFADKLLAENTGINNSLSYDQTTDDIIRELEKSEDLKIVNFASYLSALNKTGVDIDHNYLYSSLDMLNGKSVLFNNPFYNDLIPYAFYPLNRALLSHKKVLVVLGRHSIEEDIVEWLKKGIEAVTNIEFMWNIDVLDNTTRDNLDIGIVTRSDVLNIELHNANAEFLEQVGFVVIIEPSKLISTAQIGLNMLVKKCVQGNNDIVYCLCDKNCDGLVDAMSHVLLTSITEVAATNKHKGTSSYMCWETDGEYMHHRLVPNISRYLGVGTELSFAALKNQVSKTHWYGGEAFPVVDMRWIAKQYYYPLTKYANIPTEQESMDEHFATTANFWSAPVRKNSYLTVEDEAFNMFEILRDFSTRTTDQGFINVISSEYLLKDYMAENASIFEADPKAIPYIVADYTRSNRNTVLRLILMLSTYPVSEEVLNKEFSLLGIEVTNLKEQLWYEIYRCFSPITKTAELPETYAQAVSRAYELPLEFGDIKIEPDIIKVCENYNLKEGRLETTYCIDDRRFSKLCVSGLRSAGYVAEDEQGERNYLGSELLGHIYQKYLPGQFFTFGGKYYEMQHLTADGQILVRRAADHINGRPCYRQIREYSICANTDSDKIGAIIDIGGLKVKKMFADIKVNTKGYYKMERYNDFEKASCISFEGQKNAIPTRNYFNKEILCITLPEFDGKLSDNIRYTITVLFNEIFRTIFAENQEYICAVTDDGFIGEGQTKTLTYSIKGEGVELDKNAIYIIEDSQLDLGLSVAVERNLSRIFGIMHDYIDWHFQTLKECLAPAPEPPVPVSFEETDDQQDDKKKSKKKGIFSKIGNAIKKAFGKIKSWFTKKPKKDAEPTEGDGTDTEPTPTGDGNTDNTGNTDIPTKEKEPTLDEGKKKKEKKGLFGWLKRKKKKPEPEPDPVPEDVTVTVTEVDDENTGDADTTNAEDNAEDTANTGDTARADNDTATADEQVDTAQMSANNTLNEDSPKTIFGTERAPYNKRYYTLFGGENDPESIDLVATLEYLTLMGMDKNALKQAREGREKAKLAESLFRPNKPDARYCDFCGAEIYGVEYETLADGRDRCLICSKTAIKTGDEFRKIFDDVKRNMEAFFGIKINVGIKVQMVNSKTLHKRLGKAYIPTEKSDGRVLGVAIKDKNGYTLLVENGSPRIASMLTIAHELTHIWQYVNFNDKAIRKKYGKKLRLQIYEGMAKWVEIQYAYLINEPVVARREEIITSYREDEYGYGFLRYRANYSFSTGTVITKPTPFLNPETPLDMEYCGNITVKMPDIPEGDDPFGGNGGDGGNGPDYTKPEDGPINRNPDAFERYAYNQLNDDHKKVYTKLLEAINSFSESVTDLGCEVDDTEFQKIIDYVQRDHPEIFWFQHGATFYYDTQTRIVSSVSLKYCMDSAEAKKRQDKINKALAQFLPSVNDSSSDYEVVLRIYENIIKAVDYDTIGLGAKSSAEPTPDVPDDLRSIYGVFANKKAVCAGYAKALQYLVNRYGIECTYITSSTHAWNLIKLEGDYYHIDVTWGDGSDTSKAKAQSEYINYDCFCITSKMLARLDSHQPVDILPVPDCTATRCDYHVRHGLYFTSCDLDAMREAFARQIKQGNLSVSFKFDTKQAYSDAKKQFIDSKKVFDFIQYANLCGKTRLSTGYVYSVSDDRYSIAIHLKKM